MPLIRLLRFASTLFLATHAFAAGDEAPPAVRAHRQNIAKPEYLAEELDRVRREMAFHGSPSAEAVLAEVALDAGLSVAQLGEAIDAGLSRLRGATSAAAAKRESGAAVKEESTAEAAQLLTLARLLEARGRKAEAHEARMQRLAALGKFAEADEWLAGALDVAVSFTKVSGTKSAREWMEKCNALVEKEPAFRDSARARAIHSLYAAQMGDAATALENAASAVEKAFGEKHPMCVAAYEILALSPNNEREPAGRLADRSKLLRMREATLGPEHPATLRILGIYSVLLEDHGDSAEAHRLQKRVVDSWRIAGTLGTLSRLNFANSYARELRLAGANAEAEEVLRAVIPIAEKLHGPEDRTTLWMRTDLALVIGDAGNYAEAERMERALIEIRKRALGTDDPNVASSMNNVAVFLAQQGKYRDALTMYEQSYSVRRKTSEEDDEEALRTKSNIAGQLISLGRYAEAAPMVRSVLAMRTKVLGEEDRDTISSHGQLAGLLFSQGDIAAAETSARRYADDSEKILGRDHPTSRGAKSFLAAILMEKGDAAAALEYAHKLAAYHRAHPDADKPGKIDADMLLGEALFKSRDYEKARPLLIEATRAFEELSGPAHLDTLYGQLLVAQLHIATNSAPEAIPILRSIIEIVARQLDAEHPLIAEAALELAEVLAKDGASAEAAEWKARARQIADAKLHPDSPLRKRCAK